MSYILEALKKSDQQRQQHNGPSLQTIHRPIVSSNHSTLMMVIALLVVLIIVAAMAIVAYLYFNSLDTTQNLAVKSVVAPAIEMEEKTVVNKTLVEKRPPLVKALDMAAVPFNALSAEQRGLIPGMTFSFHVYSDNPIHRTIIINGRRVKQGEWVEQGLLLEEITRKGVVLNWNNQLRFTIDVVESW